MKLLKLVTEKMMVLLEVFFLSFIEKKFRDLFKISSKNISKNYLLLLFLLDNFLKTIREMILLEKIIMQYL